jgi:hypothetical protein
MGDVYVIPIIKELLDKSREGVEGEGEPGLINGCSIHCHGFYRMLKRRIL